MADSATAVTQYTYHGEEYYVKKPSFKNSVQHALEIVFCRLQNEKLSICKDPYVHIITEFCELAADAYSNLQKGNDYNIDDIATKILAAQFLTATKSINDFKSFLKTFDTTCKIDAINGSLLWMSCWFMNETNRSYLVLGCDITLKQKLLEQFLKDKLKGDVDYQWLSFILSCLQQMGVQNLMKIAENKIVAWKNYDELERYDCSLKSFKDIFYSSPFTIYVQEWFVKLRKWMEGLNHEVEFESDGLISDRPRDPPGERSVYIPPGDTNKEAYRLCTFLKFPTNCPVNPRVLAACGYFYTGYQDRVKCFCCGLCVDNWTEKDDVTADRWHTCDCKMQRGKESGNIAIGSLFPNFRLFRNQQRGQQDDETSDIGHKYDCKMQKGEESRNIAIGRLFPNFHFFRNQQRGQSARESCRSTTSFSASKNFERAQRPEHHGRGCSIRTVQSNIGSGMHQTAVQVQLQQFNQHYTGVKLAAIPSVNHKQLLQSLDLCRELDRLVTFESWRWNNQTIQYTDVLAQCGFFYLGNHDRVQCFSCEGVLRNWSYGDNVDREHRSHFPACRMVRGIETQNVLLSSSKKPTVPSSEIVLEPPDPSHAVQKQLHNLFRCLKPVSAHMRREDKRLDTFDGRWPTNLTEATPSQLSQAGFFFLGEQDWVKCWYCNGGLKHWNADDEPWIEHAKWFPTCEFLLRRKGIDFVHQIMAVFPNLPRPNIRVPFNKPLHGEQNRDPSPSVVGTYHLDETDLMWDSFSYLFAELPQPGDSE